MNQTKIQLSPDELLLVQNADMLLTKNIIIAKVYDLFGQLAAAAQEEINNTTGFIPYEVLIHSPKISKGENYKGLPYVILDFPRSFSRENSFAIRTMFWWGNFFSTTLHLKGSYQQMFSSALIRNIIGLMNADFYISMGPDEWQHDFEEINYTPLKKLGKSMLIDKFSNDSFIKLSVKLPLHEWREANEKLAGYFTLLIKAMID